MRSMVFVGYYCAVNASRIYIGGYRLSIVILDMKGYTR
jgi:hypothetical protein